MQLILETLFNGVAIGSVLLIAALGLAIVFGLMGVINLAHGELMMLGAYSTYVTQLEENYDSANVDLDEIPNHESVVAELEDFLRCQSSGN